MSTIKTGTTLTTAYQVVGDTTGAFVVQTGSTPTTAMTIGSDQNITVAGNITLNNGAADGAQLSLSSSGSSDWNWDNYSGRLRAYYGATEYFTITNSGNVGIGTSSPTQKLEVYGNVKCSSSFIGTTGTNGFALLGTGADTTSGGTVVVRNSSATYNTSGVEFYTNSAERMRIDSSGNVCVASTVSNSGAVLAVAGNSNFGNNAVSTYTTRLSGYGLTDGTNRYGSYGQLLLHSTDSWTAAARRYLITNGYLGYNFAIVRSTNANTDPALGTNGALSSGTADLILDYSGNLLLNTSDTGLTSGAGTKFITGANPYMGIVGASSVNGNSAYHLYSTGAGNYRFYVTYAGQIYATSTSISAISDRTLKQNIRDLETGLDEVMALKPRRFDWINGDGNDVAGFVAQEVAEVLPELVSDYRYSKDEEGNDITKKSLRMGDILPTLVKAIQELNAKVDAQAAEIAALKGQ